jgi:4-hydroxy-4-methyl-2-oxoglutarate aldolase
MNLSTAAISDALDAFRIHGQALGLAPLWDGMYFFGPAYTVRYRPADVEPGSVGEYVDDVPAGSVICIDNGGRTDCTVWGDILTTVASKRLIAGTVIDGVCRDVAKAIAVEYPLVTRGRFMRTGKDRVQIDAVQVAITIGTVVVKPGDLVIGNDDGVVVIPADRCDEVLKRARSIGEREAAIVAGVETGMRLDDARASEGYHLLQRS